MDKRVIHAGVWLGSIAFAQDAWAQDVAQTPLQPVSEVIQEEIVVTAQKRAERLTDVPIAVSVIAGTALTRSQINDTQSLVRLAPSLTYQQANNPQNSSFRIRGVGTSAAGLGLEPSVSVVVDGVPVARAAQGFSDLIDIERIEVLRGPQGTLFGKNATAGVLNIVTAEPSPSFEGRAEATWAERGEYRVRSTVTGPISNSVALRFTGYYNDVGGYVRNVKTDTNTLASTSWGGRLKALWEPNADLKLVAIADYRKFRTDCCSRIPFRVDTPAVATLIAPVIASPSNRSVSNDDLSYTRSRQWNASAQLDWTTAIGTVTSVTAYQAYRSADQFEADQIASVPLRFVGAASPFSGWDQNAFDLSYNQISEEARLTSVTGSNPSFVTGIYAARLDMDRSGTRRRARCASGVIGQPCAVTPTFDSSGFVADLRSSNVAAFGQLDYELVEGFHALLGARLQRETARVRGSSYAPVVAGDAIFPGLVPNSGTRERSDTATSGRFGARYEISPNSQVFATYSRGYKAFALDLDPATRFDRQTGVNPERVAAYEAGLKWSAGTVSANLAVFRANYQNLQVQTVLADPVTGTFQALVQNTGGARSQGVEVETVLRPSPNFRLGVNFVYLDATFDADGQSCALQDQAAGATRIIASNYPVNLCYRRQITLNGVTQTSTPIVDVRGGVLPVSPRYRFGLSPQLDLPMNGSALRAFVGADLTYQSRIGFSLEQDPLRVQPGYAIIDAHVGVTGLNDTLTFTVYVKNAFDVNYVTQLNHGTILATAASPFDLFANYAKESSRYFGASLAMRF